MTFARPWCTVEPLPDHQVAMSIGGTERTRWHFGPQYPRPFFYPLTAPDRTKSLTRMGHPGAPNHDHHRSVWFAHAKVLGIDFWSDNTQAFIRQQQWLAMADGDDECALAVKLGWYDGHDPAPLMEQELIAFLRPVREDGIRTEPHDYLLETQSTFTPRAESLELQQTNFGFFAVRVAKSISVYFGGGEITGSDGGQGEADLFGKPNRWVDYTGPLGFTDSPRRSDVGGITYFDHPDNVSYPSKWHVREDGWMGASVCRDGAITVSRQDPLILRYLLYAHGWPLDVDKADRLADDFSDRPAARVVRSTKKHIEYEIERG
jgi:hypothetical protein